MDSEHRQMIEEVKAVLAKYKQRHTMASTVVQQYTLDGILVETYPSIALASLITGIHHSTIGKCLTGTRKTAGGFCWKRAYSRF